MYNVFVRSCHISSETALDGIHALSSLRGDQPWFTSAYRWHGSVDFVALIWVYSGGIDLVGPLDEISFVS